MKNGLKKMYEKQLDKIIESSKIKGVQNISACIIIFLFISRFSISRENS